MPNLIAAFNTGRSALFAQSAALQTVGQNIANAATPGYHRQRVELAPSQPHPESFGFLGRGVDITEVRRVVDASLEGFLRDSKSGLSSLEEQRRMLARIEATFNELGGSSLTTSLGDFFSAVEKLTSNPEDFSTRQEVLASAQALSETFNRIDAQLRGLQDSENKALETAVGDVNRLTEQIAQLNEQIVQAEQGRINVGSANDLRDLRDQALSSLSELVGVRATETDHGSVNVLAGSDFLVYEDQSFALDAVQAEQDGKLISQIRFAVSQKTLTVTGGTVEGQLISRDMNVEKFLNDMNKLANAIIANVNRIHSQGVGLEVYEEATSLASLHETDVPLGEAGLDFPVENGTFTLGIREKASGKVTEVTVGVDADGLDGDDASLEGLMSEINRRIRESLGLTGTAQAPVEASITTRNELKLEATDEAYDFRFGQDSSGVLAALGINTLFGGSGAFDMRVRQQLLDNPGLLTAARSMNAGDNSNALALAALREQKLMGEQSATFEEFLEGTIGQLGILAMDAKRRVDNQQVLTSQLENEREQVSGVSLDEEALNLVKHQRAFQGAARYLQVVDDLLETLINGL